MMMPTTMAMMTYGVYDAMMGMMPGMLMATHMTMTMVFVYMVDAVNDDDVDVDVEGDV